MGSNYWLKRLRRVGIKSSKKLKYPISDNPYKSCLQWMVPVWPSWLWSGIFQTTCFSTKLGKTARTCRSWILLVQRLSPTLAWCVSCTLTRSRSSWSAGTERGLLGSRREVWEHFLTHTLTSRYQTSRNPSPGELRMLTGNKSRIMSIQLCNISHFHWRIGT